MSFMLLGGLIENPQATMVSYEQTTGVTMLWAGIMTIGFVKLSYKKGEKGAWYAFWIIPIVLIGYIAVELSIGGAYWPLDVLLLIIALLGLLLPIRKFFHKK
ncbi:MAG: hypothetical protein ACE5KU_04210 [Nitrososphaerales archaeon]